MGDSMQKLPKPYGFEYDSGTERKDEVPEVDDGSMLTVSARDTFHTHHETSHDGA